MKTKKSKQSSNLFLYIQTEINPGKIAPTGFEPVTSSL